MRTCKRCGGAIVGRSTQARYCSDTCQQKVAKERYRAKQKASLQAQRAETELAIQRGKYAQATIAQIRRSLEQCERSVNFGHDARDFVVRVRRLLDAYDQLCSAESEGGKTPVK